MWRVIFFCVIAFYAIDIQSQNASEEIKYPIEGNKFLYENLDGKINYFTLDSLPIFNQSFDRLSSFDVNGYAWANAGSEMFIINVIKKELIHFPNELRFLIHDEPETVSFVSEISNKVYFPLEGGLYFDQKGGLIAAGGSVISLNKRKTIQNQFQQYLSYTYADDLNEQGIEEIRIISKYLKVKGEWVFEPGLYSDIEFINDFNNVESYFLVEQNGKCGVVCSTGDLVVPCNYSKIEMISKDFENEYQYFFLVENEKKGIISGDGSILTPCIYDDILYEDLSDYSDGLLMVL